MLDFEWSEIEPENHIRYAHTSSIVSITIEDKYVVYNSNIEYPLQVKSSVYNRVYKIHNPKISELDNDNCLPKIEKKKIKSIFRKAFIIRFIRYDSDLEYRNVEKIYLSFFRGKVGILHPCLLKNKISRLWFSFFEEGKDEFGYNRLSYLVN